MLSYKNVTLIIFCEYLPTHNQRSEIRTMNTVDKPLSLQDTRLVVEDRNKSVQLFQVIITDNMPNIVDTIVHKI
jgi:hypothetical protein